MEGLLEVTALDDQSMAKRSLDKGSTPQVPKEPPTDDKGPSRWSTLKRTAKKSLDHTIQLAPQGSVNGDADAGRHCPDPLFIQG